MRDYRAARAMVGLVPQEIALDIFATVWKRCRFSRGLFGRPPDPAFIERLLRDLSLWDKRDAKDRRTLGRHEAARDDRQGAEPRARHPVPRRADRRRRRQPAPRHVGAGAAAARAGRHHHPHHPLHRGGRGDGGPRRRHQQGPPRAGRGEGGAHAQARQTAPDARAAASRCRRCRPNSPAGRSSSRTTARGSPTASTPPPRTPASRRCCAASARSASISRISTPRRSTLEDIFVDLVGTGGMNRATAINLGGVWAIYRYEMRARSRTIWQSVATPVITTALYFVVFGGAIGSRMQPSRRGRLRRVHRAGAHHAVAADAKHLQRLDRHLLSQIHRHDLRAPLGAAVLGRGGHRLCRRGGDQVGRHRAGHSGDGDAVRAGAGRPSVLDGRLLGADLDRVQPVRLHHRHLGARISSSWRSFPRSW